jgi:hypothetical protein
MAKFLSRLFGGGSSSSKRGTYRGSQSSINDGGRRTGASANMRPTASLENLSSYHINPKELDKHKLHKASWEGNLYKVERLAGPGQIDQKDQHFRVKSISFSNNILKFCFLNRLHYIWQLSEDISI